MLQSVDLIIYPEWIVPILPDDRVLTHHAIVVDKNTIVAIDHLETIQSIYTSKNETHLPGQALLPGFVNAHTHAAMSLLKGYADDLPLMEWLENHIWPAEAKHMSDEFVFDGTQLAIAEMIRSGTTCFNDMYFMPNMTAKTAIESGMRSRVGLVIIDFPSAWANNADEYLTKGLAVFDEHKHQSLVQFSLAPHAPYTVSNDPLIKIATISNELDLPIHMHVHETQFEVDNAIAQTKLRPLNRLHDLGLLSPLFQAVHMTAINDDDIALVAENGVHVIHCPESNMKLASGFCPTQKFIDANINLAIGTDGSSSNNDLDMIGEMRSAAFLSKVHTGNASSLSAYQALKAATYGGASALGFSEICGSIEVGKKADLCAIDLNQIETQPIYDVISQIVYCSDRRQVTHVWCDGKPLMTNRELTTIDTSICLNTAKRWQSIISEKGM